MINVVLTGIYFPMAILRYFEAALQRREDVNLYTVGPYTGPWIPWQGGMNLANKYAKTPDLPLSVGPVYPTGAAITPIGFVENKLPWVPDVWLQIDAGFHLRGKPSHGKNIIVGTDPHVLDYNQQRAYADTFYCMQTPYAANGDEYLPYAYDPVWHAPEPLKPQFDAALIGMAYPERTQLVNALRQKGVDVHYELGPCFDEARTLYNQSVMGLNWSSLEDLTARVFELMGIGVLAVVNRVPDLGQFFKDEKHLIAFSSLGEAVEKVTYYLDNLDKATKIARAGHKAVKAHTWDARIEQILDAI